MTKNKDLISERLKVLNQNNETLKNEKKQNVVEKIATGKEEKPDFMKMAETLEAKKVESVSKNQDYTKDTIYIRDDLYAAMQSLCTKAGDKKKHVNAAYEMYLTKKYKELHRELNLNKQ